MRRNRNYTTHFFGSFRPFFKSHSPLPAPPLGRDMRWAISRKVFENAIELRERLKPCRERDLADPKIGICQKITRFFEPGARDVIDKIHAGYC